LLLVAGAVVQPLIAAPPDILIDETARVIAITDTRGRLVLRPGKGDGFVREVWADRHAPSAESWTAAGDHDAGLRCDADGCILDRNRRRILIAFTPAALAEDCASVDAAVSLVPSHVFCGRTPTVDDIDVRRHGAAALRITAQGIETRFVDDGVGDRRWSPAAKPKRRATAMEPEAIASPSTAAEDPPADPEP
jgi:competence protein ComEC